MTNLRTSERSHAGNPGHTGHLDGISTILAKARKDTIDGDEKIQPQSWTLILVPSRRFFYLGAGRLVDLENHGPGNH